MRMETDYAAFYRRPLKHQECIRALQIPAFSLVQLDSFKQGLEISSAETLNQTKAIEYKCLFISFFFSKLQRKFII